MDPSADEPVDRTQLSKDAFAGQIPLDQVALPSLAENDVQRINASVTEFSAADRHARLSNGDVLKFDKAMVATGGTPKLLPIAGAESAFVLRHIEDVRRIIKACEQAKTVAIIGASFIGMEAASALVQKGLDVTVIGKDELPFKKQFGETVANALKSFHERNGAKLRLGVEITRIDRGSVTFQDGIAAETIPADVVVMGVGIEPALAFRHDLPKALDGGGIQTDYTLRITDAVWVAGDIAGINGVRIEHWRVAQQHGRIAALAMLGFDAAYQGVPYFWTYHFGKRLGYLGHAEDWDDTFVKGNLKELDFLLLYLKDGHVKAPLNCGYETEMAALAEPMRTPLPLEDARQRIDAKQYVNRLAGV